MIDLEQRLRQALGASLPGVEAQVRMAPRPRAGWRPDRIPPGTRQAAALVLLYERAATPHMLLTLRRADLSSHAGQVSLPGGAIDEGESIEQAARREAFEEVGLRPDAVDVLGTLTPLHIPASGFLLHPVVGVTAPEPTLAAADTEVERLIEVPLDLLRGIGTLRVERWNLRGLETDVPFFHIDGHRVWGATAMVLAELLAVLGAPPDPWEHPAGGDSRVVT